MNELPKWAEFDANDYQHTPPNDNAVGWDTTGILCEQGDDIEDVALLALAYRYEIARLRALVDTMAKETDDDR